ncbi:MAG: 2-amino-4-hydroxy-6-hydroxymethyldihydropteridine diphosphokinase [Odoribacter sp.]|nr:2-amino-4-hydroxy-6-hydroxymethyldihydropteridine diphosphokinase [Bacteroidales bacterium]MBR2980628.1 2-amino-4-hydroxy-6-hydroxymethyldihydropteridine diphosphokinase [Odoribacter sp.]
MDLLLLLGGNSGDRLALLRNALAMIEERIGVIKGCSSVYETEPWGFECSDSFYNVAAFVDTELSGEEALDIALNIEQELGRVRSSRQRYGSRTMDIDIILCGDQIINTDRLQVPHPRMCERRFVLVPAVELMPDYVHPIRNLTLSTLLANCSDNLEVKKVGEIFGLKE